MDNYDVRTLKTEDEVRDTEINFYKNVFDSYRSCTNTYDNNATFLMNFVKKYEERKGQLIELTRRTVVVAFTSQSSYPSSRFYNLYYKHMLIKHKP